MHSSRAACAHSTAAARAVVLAHSLRRSLRHCGCAVGQSSAAHSPQPAAPHELEVPTVRLLPCSGLQRWHTEATLVVRTVRWCTAALQQLTRNRDLLYVVCALHWPCLLPCRCSVRCAVQLLECERQQLRLPSRAHTDTGLTNRRCLAHAVAQPCCGTAMLCSPVWQSTVTASTN